MHHTFIAFALGFLLAGPVIAPHAGGAEDNVAPLFTSGNPIITLGTVDEGSAAIEVDLQALLDPLMADYDPETMGLTGARGIALIGSETNGFSTYSVTWEYFDPNVGDWQQVYYIGGEYAWLLPLTVDTEEGPQPVRLRYRIEEDDRGEFALAIRAWDGSAGSDFSYESTLNPGNYGYDYGGSPTAFSAETRRLKVYITPVNDPPAAEILSTRLAILRVDSPVSARTELFDLIADTFDPDHEGIGLAITAINTSLAVTVDYSMDRGDSWIPMPNIPSGSALCVPRGASLRVTPTIPPAAGAEPGEVLLTAYQWDGNGELDGDRLSAISDLAASLAIGSSTIDFTQPVSANHPPIINDITPFTIAQGSTVDIPLSAVDPDVGDTLYWLVTSGPTGINDSLVFLDAVGPDALLRFTAGRSPSSTLTILVGDSDGNVTERLFTFDILVNQPPVFTVLPGSIAVAGQPYRGLVKAVDPEGDVTLNLVAQNVYGGSLPGGLIFTPNAEGNGGVLSGNPSAGVHGVVFIINDGMNQEQAAAVYITTSLVDPTAITTPSFPLPGTTTPPPYYAIAPGSPQGFDDLVLGLTPLSSSQARGFWWSTAARVYRDVEASAPAVVLQPTAAVFVTSTAPLSLALSSVPYPMPFAVDLPPSTIASGSGWTFFGVPPLWNGNQVETSHAWSDFRLETVEGEAADADLLFSALAPSGAEQVPPPWGYDPPPAAGYVPSSTITTGRGYWIRNRSDQALRLVRVSLSDEGPRVTGMLPVAQVARRMDSNAARASSTNNEPPPPPGHSASAPSSGGCGLGSGIAGLALMMSMLAMCRSRTGTVR